MTRGLPYSFLVHALVLILVIVYGNAVSRPPLQPMRAIPFHVVHRNFVDAPPVESVPEVVDTPPVTQPEIQKMVPPAALPPKEVPVKPRQQKQPQEQETAPIRKTPPAADVPVTGPNATADPVTLASGPRVDATDADFPFSWYLTRIEGLVDSRWDPPQLGFGKRPRISCAVHFEIVRNGTVGGISLTKSSGVGVYDREALRAVQATRLPPLPPQYPGSRLGVTFIFNLEPDS